MAKTAPKSTVSAQRALTRPPSAKASAKRPTVGKSPTSGKAMAAAKSTKPNASKAAKRPAVAGGRPPGKTAKATAKPALNSVAKGGSKPKAKPIARAAKRPAARPAVAAKPAAVRPPAGRRAAAVAVPSPKALPNGSAKPTNGHAARPKPAPAPVVAAKAVAVAPPPAAVVSTPPKPRRAGSGLGVRDLQHFADLLREKRREIVGDMHSMEGEALRSGSGGLSTLPVHTADMGTDNYEQEFTLGLVEKDRNLLREINHALAKIPLGTYGICEGTGDPIGKPRLEVQPWARHGIEYARLRERNGRGVRMF